MKRNDFATFIVYVGMLAIAILVGILVIRPLLVSWNSSMKILTVILSLVVAVVLNSLLIEVGHAVGAAAGRYEVYKWLVLGVGFKKDKKNKRRFTVENFNGLTGETEMRPLDKDASTPSAVTILPLLFFLVEVIVGVILIAVSNRFVNNADNPNSNMVWLHIASVIVMAVGGMIYLYNYFPARLDSETDGYRMVLLSKPVNRQAYNQMLENRYREERGMPLEDFPVYDDVTDYTAELNLDKAYAQIAQEKYGQAILTVQKTLDTPEHISGSTRNEAMAMKLSLVLLTSKREVGSAYYENIENKDRNYIATLTDGPSLRSYLLITGIIENSPTEVDYALEKAPKIMKKEPEGRRKCEMKLYRLSLERIKNLHPSWTLKEPVFDFVSSKPSKKKNAQK